MVSVQKTIYFWLGKDAKGGPSWAELSRIKKENKHSSNLWENSLLGIESQCLYVTDGGNALVGQYSDQKCNT